MRVSSTGAMVCAVALLVPIAAAAQGLSASQAGTDQATQEQTRRPFRGLFGAPADPTVGRQSLDVTLSAFGAYDDDLVAADTRTTLSGYPVRGTYPGATARVAYSYPGTDVSGVLEGEAAVNSYPTLHKTDVMYRVGGGLSAHVARHTTVFLAGDAVYAPQFRLGLFVDPLSLTGEANPFSTVATDLDLFRAEAYRSSAQAAVTQDVGPRASLQVYGTFANVNDLGSSQFDYESHTIGARLSRRITQDLGFHVGYAYETARYHLPPAAQIQNIDAGVDYNKALSLSRRTTLTFSTGAATVAQQTAGGAVAQTAFYRFVGAADLHREMGRTWTGTIGYRRSVHFDEGFALPFLSDAATARLDGFVSRRAQFNATADYSVGSVGLSNGTNGFNSGSAAAGLQYALSRRWALFARYVYYHYRFDSGVALDPRIAPRFDRQGVRAGITASFPILR